MRTVLFAVGWICAGSSATLFVLWAINRWALVERATPAAPGETTSLTQEQKLAWKKFQKNSGSGYHVASLYGGAWEMRSDNGSQWNNKLVWHGGTTIQGVPLAEAEQAAKDMASRNIVKVTVVLDLLSSPTPKVICWFHDDGTGAKKWLETPKKEYGDSLQKYLQFLQTDGVN